MDRRNFLLLSSLGFSVFVLPSLQGCNKAVTFDSALSHPEMLGQFIDQATLLKVGNRYLTMTRESDQSQLVRLLNEAIADLKSGDPGLRLEKAIQQDFLNNRIAIIEGWVLSITEARQCALYAVTYQS